MARSFEQDVPRGRRGAKVKSFQARLPEALIEALAALAERNGRSLAREAESAFRRHLASPPVLSTEAEPPELPRAVEPAPAERPRGRRRGG